MLCVCYISFAGRWGGGWASTAGRLVESRCSEVKGYMKLGLGMGVCECIQASSGLLSIGDCMYVAILEIQPVSPS